MASAADCGVGILPGATYQKILVTDLVFRKRLDDQAAGARTSHVMQ